MRASVIGPLQCPEQMLDVLAAPRLAARPCRKRVQRIRDEAEAEQIIERAKLAGSLGLGVGVEEASRALRVEPVARFVLADLPRRVRELPGRPVDAGVLPVDDPNDAAVAHTEVSAVDVAVHRTASEQWRGGEPLARPLVGSGEYRRHLDDPQVP